MGRRGDRIEKGIKAVGPIARAEGGTDVADFFYSKRL